MLPGCKQMVTSNYGLQAAVVLGHTQGLSLGWTSSSPTTSFQLSVFSVNCVGMGNQKGPSLQRGLLEP